MSVSSIRTRLRSAPLTPGLELGLVAGMMLVAALLRLLFINTAPGWELDEVVYAKIGQNMLRTGAPSLVGGAPYLSHPPFYFSLLSAWFGMFGAGILQARIFAALSQLVALLVAYRLVRLVAGRAAALITLLFLVLEGWLVFTARIGWIENGQLILIGGALIAYQHAITRNGAWRYALAGALMGASIIYKHIALFLVVFVALEWFVRGRGRAREYGMLAGSLALVVAAYVGGMVAVWGDAFIQQNMNQVLRTFGAVDSPGLNYDLGTAISAAASRYWMFFSTVIVFVVGVPLALYRGYQLVRRRGGQPSILVSWAVAVVVFLGVIALRSPHYYILLLFPLLCLLAEELEHAPQLHVRRMRIAGAFVALGLVTWGLRFGLPHDNVLASIQTYAAANIPGDAHVFSTEPVCTVILQPCEKLEGKTPERVAAAIGQSDWVLAYESRTQPFPKVPGQTQATFSGFKDTITVVRLAK
ncbi:MAG TPA: glycosyltransferase family 39 protein [Herpetosiphonaceae bacterium]